jgi:hypothetical protein
LLIHPATATLTQTFNSVPKREKAMKEQDDDEPTPSEARRAEQAKRARFLEWCKDHQEDPEDEGAWDSFNETDSSWEDMDEDDRAGWTDNMNKD